MRGEAFQKWFQEILPNPDSVIVMDNVSYHAVKAEKLPTTKRLAQIERSPHGEQTAAVGGDAQANSKY
jgi:hypothetical protein